MYAYLQSGSAVSACELLPLTLTLTEFLLNSLCCNHVPSSAISCGFTAASNRAHFCAHPLPSALLDQLSAMASVAAASPATGAPSALDWSSCVPSDAARRAAAELAALPHTI